MFHCSNCFEYGDDFNKKQKRLARRGQYALCTRCWKEQLGLLHKCQVCNLLTDNFPKGAGKRALQGGALTCRACHQKKKAKKERKREEERERYWNEYEKKRQKEEANRLHQPYPPRAHPDQNHAKLKRTPDATLQVTSGGICFGVRKDCTVAASQPLHSVEEYVYGSVCNSIRARNGTWLAYDIVHDERKEFVTTVKLPRTGSKIPEVYPTAWLVCHEDLDPVQECRYLLYHSVQEECGGAEVSYHHPVLVNDHLTRMGICKIGRYCWGHWQAGCHGGEEFKRVYEHGFQVIDYGMAQEKKWDNAVSHLGFFENHGRIHFQEGQAISFLMFSWRPLFQYSCFEYFTKRMGHHAHPLGHEKREEWKDRRSNDDNSDNNDDCAEHIDDRPPLPGQQRITDFFATAGPNHNQMLQQQNENEA